MSQFLGMLSESLPRRCILKDFDFREQRKMIGSRDGHAREVGRGAFGE
jgi:hypothetical protein